MRKRNFNIAPYFRGISSDTIRQLADEMQAHLDDESWEPTDFEGESLPQGEADDIFQAYGKVIEALESFAGKRKVIIHPDLLRLG